jgi:hypothetical protein
VQYVQIRERVLRWKAGAQHLEHGRPSIGCRITIVIGYGDAFDAAVMLVKLTSIFRFSRVACALYKEWDGKHNLDN